MRPVMSFKLRVALAPIVLLLAVQARAAVPACAPIAGTFLVEGEGTSSDHDPEPTRFRLADGAGRQAHHFRYALDPAARTVQVVVYTASGERMREVQRTSNYACKGGEIVRESEASGSSEGCSYKSQFKSTVRVREDGSLAFTSQEHWEYGWLCFRKRQDVERVSSFPRYPAPGR